MIPIFTLSYVARLLLITFMFTDFGRTNDVPAKTTEGFAVVELFTSEGCSSCPAADEAIRELSKKFPGNVFFLSYHVDYWNYLGWKDEFSSSAFTERQRRYGSHFELNSIYTPQAIVNGKTEFVGSVKSKLSKTITDDLKINTGASFELRAKKDSTGNITVYYKTTSAGKNDRLMIALVQLMATTHVKRGENKGRELKHINIVRELKTADKNSPSIQFKLPPELSVKDVKLIAFLQENNTLKIIGAKEATTD